MNQNTSPSGRAQGHVQGFGRLGQRHHSPEPPSPGHSSKGKRQRNGSKSSDITSSPPAGPSSRKASKDQSFISTDSRNEIGQKLRASAPPSNTERDPELATDTGASTIRHSGPFVRISSGDSHRLAPGVKQTSQSVHDLMRPARDEPSLDFARTTSMRNLRHGSTHSNHSTPGKGAIGQYEEKRGFFKRMFGSSSSRGNLGVDSAPPESPAVSRNASFAVAATPHPSARDSSPAPVPNRELNKKASFFRRKKKSISEASEIPQLPIHTVSSLDSTSTARSSLYRAMDPYLATENPRTPGRPAPSPPASTPSSSSKAMDSESNASTDNDLTLFHSGYTGSPEDDAARATTPGSENNNLYTGLDTTPTRKRPSVAEALGKHSRNPSMIMSDDDGDATPRRQSHNKVAASHKSGSTEPNAIEAATQQPTSVGAPIELLSNSAISTSDDSFATATQTPRASKHSSRVGASFGGGQVQADELGLTYEDASNVDQVPAMPDLGDMRNNSHVARNMSVATASTSLTAATALMEGPTAEDRERAQSIFSGSESMIPRGQVATYLGERKAANVNTLYAFMELFNFTQQTILGGLRMLCKQIVLRAESQQVDRILVSFADRWCTCNPNHGFVLADVVHTICYSLLLLNTDMHMADIESKMSRGQFVKNTLPTIKRVVAEATPAMTRTEAQPERPAMLWQDSTNSIGTQSEAAESTGTSSRRMSTDSRRPTLTKRLSWSFGMAKPDGEEDRVEFVPNSGSNALVSERIDGKPAEWHFELEAILKSFFTAIKHEALPLNREIKSTLRRANSIKSMAPSEMSMKSRKTGFHSVSARWGNRNPRSKMYASSQYASSRTSFEDGSSLFSHTGASSAWSKLSLGKTMTTMSTESSYHLGPDQGFPQTIGFANALSQINAREIAAEDDGASISIDPGKFLLPDDTLELAGAPWAKEGMVKHKHHLETTDKKAKERNWNECFAVIERGYLRLFSFNTKGGKSGSLGVRKGLQLQRGKAASIAPSVVGGGNWTANAEQLGAFLLRQTIASTLPPPGYSKARPHVWALSLPTGAVHLFQVGTPEIATEFMKTANYWSARLSKEPLMGGVENTEYGWSDAIIVPSLIHPSLVASATAARQGSSPPSTATTGTMSPDWVIRSPGHRHGGVSAHNSLGIPPLPRASISGSIRSSIDARSSVKLPGDRAHLEEWKPPAQSMMASQLMEVDQLQALKDYVAGVEADLGKHNELRADIPGAYTPRHPNAARAIANWEKKSSYLLREIVKFRTYVDALAAAQEEKKRFDIECQEREREKEEREKRKEDARRKKAADEAGEAAAAAAAGDANANVLRVNDGVGLRNDGVHGGREAEENEAESTPRLGSGAAVQQIAA